MQCSLNRKFTMTTQPHLLYLSDPPTDVLLESIQESRVRNEGTQLFHSRFLPGLRGLLDGAGDGGMDDERDLRDVDVLLQVEQTHFEFIHLLLHRRNQLVPLAVGRQ